MANVLTSYYRPKPGGFCTRFFRAIEALLHAGHTVHYLSVVPFPIAHPRCHFHRFPWPWRKTEGYVFWGCYIFLAPFLLIGLGFQHHITHLFAFGHTYALLLQPLKILRRLPLTLFLRGDPMKNHKIQVRSQWLLKLESWMEGLAIYDTRIHGVSRELVQRVVRRHSRLRPRSSSVLRNDLKPFAAGKSSSRWRGSEGCIRMACVGVLDKGKNQLFLLDIMKNIGKNQAQLSFYGSGPLAAKIQHRINTLGLGDSVFLMGWVNQEDLWPQVDLLLMPSVHEGAPNAVLEALARNIPVLASDIPEHREILPEGSLIPLDDAALWIEQIQALLTKPERGLAELAQKQSNCAGRFIFNWDQQVCACIVAG